MKKIVNVGIGGRSFVIDEDAYFRLKNYLEDFRRNSGSVFQAKEVMDDLEMRIAEIFSEALSSRQEVVDMAMVNAVIAQLGMPDGSAGNGEDYQETCRETEEVPVKKLYRDVDHRSIGGVCSGLACYFGVDVLVIRIIMVILVLFATFGFWIYVILWLAVPAARTGVQKCEMRGIPVNAENLRKFYNNKK